MSRISELRDVLSEEARPRPLDNETQLMIVRMMLRALISDKITELESEAETHEL